MCLNGSISPFKLPLQAKWLFMHIGMRNMQFIYSLRYDVCKKLSASEIKLVGLFKMLIK